MIRTARISACYLIVASLAGTLSCFSASLSISAARTNTLYQSESGDLSNGSGDYFFVGRSNHPPGTVDNPSNERGLVRRGLVLFDVTGSLPRNAVVTAAKLSIFVSNVRPDRPSLSLESPVTVHELLAPWGSAGSDAVQQEGAGTRAMAGDATWTDRFLGGESWLTPGGDFELNPAALAILGEASLFYELASDAMVDDVNHWLSSPESNHGWILVGDESTHSTARRLNSANNPFAATRPTLTLEFHTAPLPEPRTVLLLAVSVGIHLIRRRKPDSRT